MRQPIYDVFISYSRKDTTIADSIIKAFNEVGITYFIDRQGISGGMEFPAILAKAIRDSRIFLFLASKNSYQSKFTQSEIVYAFNKKERQNIIPYIIDGSSLPEELEFTFSAINWRNMKDHPIETVLIDDILNRVGKQKNTIAHIPTDKESRQEPLKPSPKTCIKKRSAVNIGDFFFDDGTTSPTLIAGKKAVGIVFSLENTNEEKSQGWVHGHIFSLSNVKLRVPRKYPLIGEHLEMCKDLHWTRGYDKAEHLFPDNDKYTINDVLNDKDGYIYTNNVKTNDPSYEVFHAAKAFNDVWPIPQNTTSGWYLPAIGQLYELLTNLGRLPIASFITREGTKLEETKVVLPNLRMDFIKQMNKYVHNIGLCRNIASSSECGKKNCWYLQLTPFVNNCDMFIETISKDHFFEVFPVAAF